MSNATNAGTSQSNLRPNLRTQIHARFHFHSNLSTNKKTAGKSQHHAVDDVMCASDLKSRLDIQGSLYFKTNQDTIGEYFSELP